MKVFVSWSMDRSKKIANALQNWLPDVFQSLEVFMSDHNIQAGDRWGNELSVGLEHRTFTRKHILRP
jgi:hypothetical protein